MLIKIPLVFHSIILFISIITILSACSSEGDAADDKTNPTSAVEQEDQDLGTIDTESIYQFEGEWHSQNDDTVQLKILQGKIPVMAMAFTNCAFACPKIVEDMKNIESKAPEDKKDDLIFVLVSFDSKNDHPERLREYAKEMGLSDKWLLLHGSEENVRELSMLLNVNYKKQRDGLFAHSNEIILLDRKGRIVTSTEGLGIDPRPVVQRIHEL